MSALDTRPMSRDEYLNEAQWFLDAGVSPALIATELGMSANSINTAARYKNRPEIAKAFQAESHREGMRR
jgi:hypothetical protein